MSSKTEAILALIAFGILSVIAILLPSLKPEIGTGSTIVTPEMINEGLEKYSNCKNGIVIGEGATMEGCEKNER